jgi:glucan phosphoethanolaminetransferase (alkaline phosphatase superfamily)
MLKKISIFTIFAVLFFLLFEFTTKNSFYYLAQNLFQPQDLKGASKVAAYGISYLFILLNFLLILLLKKGKLFYLLLIFVSLTLMLDATYYFNGLSRGFSKGQFITAFNEKGHILDAVSTFYSGALKALLLLVVILGVTWFFRKVYKERYLLIPLLLLPLSLFGSNMIIKDTDDETYNYLSFIKVPLSIFNAYNDGLMDIPFAKRDQVVAIPSKDSHYKNIILLVDESVRGDYLSVNGYPKRTTEYLSSLDNLLTLGSISSVANSSANSNYILRNGITIKELPDKGFKTLKKPNIFQYAKKAGYKTVFLDAQSNYQGLQNIMSNYDLEHIDHFITLKNKDDYAKSDRRILKKLNKVLEKTDDKFFVYFVKYGSHFKWQLNYPKEKEIFKPALSIYDSLDFDSREKAVNTYLNSIKWGVDSFFETLLKSMNTENTVIIHTADHGQNIVENDILITHGVEKNPPSTMANVPLLIYADDIDYIKSKFEKVELNSYSQYQLFPSLLDLMGYDSDTTEQYGPTFWKEPIYERKFFSGSIFGKGYTNKYVQPNIN